MCPCKYDRRLREARSNQSASQDMPQDEYTWSINNIFMLTDWNRPIQTDRTFSLKKGSKLWVVFQEWQSNYDRQSKYYSIYRSIPEIFCVTNLQNRRPFWRGGLTLCRGHSRHILFTDVSFLIRRTAGGDLMSQHYHTKLIAKKTTTRWTP